MRRRRVFYAIALGIVTVAYATLAIDAHLEGYWQMSRLEGLLLAGITFAWGLIAAPWPWRPRGDRRPSSIGTPRPPRQRPAEPPRLPPRPAALTETTQILPGAVMAAAWRDAQASVEAAEAPVAVAEQEATAEGLGGLGLYLSGHAAGAHPESDDGQRPEVDHLRGFAEGAVDRGREDDEERDGGRD